MTMEYPEHEKLAAVKDKSQAIGEFMEWLTGEMEYVIATWDEDEYCTDRLFPARRDVQDLLVQFFRIDRNKLEDEKRAMLAELRRTDEQR